MGRGGGDGGGEREEVCGREALALFGVALGACFCRIYTRWHVAEGGGVRS